MNAILAEPRCANTREWLAITRAANLPTVWSNVLAGACLAQGGFAWRGYLTAALAGSFLYVGGVALNDVFDSEFDRIHRPERPIPAGRITRERVRLAGAILLVAGCASWLTTGLAAGALGIVLAGIILGYDAIHKRHSVGTVVMGLCRAMLYPLTGFALGAPTEASYGLGLLLGLYVCGFSLIARHESGSSPIALTIRRNVPRWIAAMVLVDAIAIAWAAPYFLPLTAIFLAITLWAQRHLPST